MLSSRLQIFAYTWPLCLIVAAGCSLPWQGKNHVPTIQEGSGSSASAVATNPAPASQNAVALDKPTGETTASYNLPEPEPSQEEALADVLADLHEIGAIDKGAQETLMQDLREAKPSNWPLIVHSFRAALAYRQQLREREAPQMELPGTVAGPTNQPEIRVARQDTRTTAAADLPPPFAPGTAPPPTEAPPQASPRSALPADNPLREPAMSRSEPPRGAIQPASYEQKAAAAVEDPFDAPAPIAGNRRQHGDSAPIVATWEAQLDEAIRRLEEATTDAPATTDDVHRHAVLRMLYLVADRGEDALRPVPGIAPAQQDYWSKQLFALSTYLDEDSQPDGRRRAAAARAQLAEAAAILGELGTLSVRNLAFCEDVTSFGVYTPIEDPQFSPGQRVLLYAEAENYRSEPTEKGFHTVLASSYEVHDEQGRRIGGGEFPEVRDTCQSRRRDFHIQYGVVLPQRIYPGKYTLQLVIHDVQSHKIGRAQVAFELRDAK